MAKITGHAHKTDVGFVCKKVSGRWKELFFIALGMPENQGATFPCRTERRFGHTTEPDWRLVERTAFADAAPMAQNGDVSSKGECK